MKTSCIFLRKNDIFIYVHIFIILCDDLIPPMRRNRESLSRAQESQSLFDRRDESTRIIHRRELGSYTPHGFYEQSQREVAQSRERNHIGVDFSCTRRPCTRDRETHLGKTRGSEKNLCSEQRTESRSRGASCCATIHRQVHLETRINIGYLTEPLVLWSRREQRRSILETIQSERSSRRLGSNLGSPSSPDSRVPRKLINEPRTYKTEEGILARGRKEASSRSPSSWVRSSWSCWRVSVGRSPQALRIRSVQCKDTRERATEVFRSSTLKLNLATNDELTMNRLPSWTFPSNSPVNEQSGTSSM